MESKTDRYEALRADFTKWMFSTFPTQDITGKVNHLAREVEELKKTPRDGEEMADVFLLLMGIAEVAGVNLIEQAERKLEINKKRKWGAPNADGSVSHLPSDEPPEGCEPFEIKRAMREGARSKSGRIWKYRSSRAEKMGSFCFYESDNETDWWFFDKNGIARTAENQIEEQLYCIKAEGVR